MNDLARFWNEIISKIPKPKKPLVAEIRIHSLDAQAVMDALRVRGPIYDAPATGPHLGPILGDLVIRQDDKTIPGFAEFYDGRGNMVKTVKVSQ